MSKLTQGLFSALAVSALALSASAQNFTTSLVASGFNRPVFMTSPPGDANRMFVLEQHTGRIEIIKNGVILPTAFVTIPGLSTGNEQGLLGLAFHPDFATNGEFFVNYTVGGNGTRIAKYTVSGTPMTNDVANPAGDIIMTIIQPFTNHNGGMIAFGPDEFLYIGTGDGGSSGDPGNRAQNPLQLLGKMLRIDVNGDDFPADSLRDYAIPAGQPVFSPAGTPELWMKGLRNPWRWSFDRETGDMWIGDVGQNNREEVNFAAAGTSGQNWGWKCKEGNACFNNSNPFCSCASAALVDPIFDYANAPGKAVTGGYAYRGPLDCIQGVYFFADSGFNGGIWTSEADGLGGFTTTNRTAEFGIPGSEVLVSFAEDDAGNVYILDFLGNEIHLIELDSACPQPGVDMCNGDGGDQMGCTDCPCMNNATPGTVGGCLNRVGDSARLRGSGVPSVSSDTLRFEMDGVSPNELCVLLSGDTIAPGVSGNPCFGLNTGLQSPDRDGLRCSIQNIKRHGNRRADSNGEVGIANNRGWGTPDAPFSGLLFQAGFGAGQTRSFQAIYREQITAGCMRGLNTSQSVTYTMLP